MLCDDLVEVHNVSRSSVHMQVIMTFEEAVYNGSDIHMHACMCTELEDCEV